MPVGKTALRTTGAQTRAMRTVRGRGILEISTDTINAIEDYIRWAEAVPGQMVKGMDMLSKLMALANQGIAQEMSYGAYDPQNRNPSQAWRIPVRRISEKYFYGWRVKRLGMGVYMLYNDSREAYFIEYGIHRSGTTGEVSPRRIRRPIRKLSLRRTLEAMMRTQAYHRVWAEIFVDRQRKTSHGFTQTVQSPRMGSFTGPMLGRRLP
jgi:hypothetical protein